MFYHFFLQFYLTSLQGKEYFAKEPEPVGAGCFWPLGAGASRKKYQEPEPVPLEKKPGAGAAKKLASSSALREDKKHKEIVF